MDLQAYAAFTAALTQTLARDSRVLGLMAAGSMAGQSHHPDEWSDHDFWVVVETGAELWFRTHREWLPDSEQIVLMFVDPVHDGVTAIYRSGHLAEFAVSDRAGLLHAKINDYRVLIDRINLAADLARMAQTTTAEFEATVQDDGCLIGRFLTCILIGMGRYHRGEHLSARQFITVSSLHALLRLITKHVPPEAPTALDNLDPLRRFEMAYPAVAAAIHDLMQRDLDHTAAGLVDLAERLLRDSIINYPAEAVAAIRQRIVVSTP